MFVVSISVFEIILLASIKNLPVESVLNINTISIFTIIVGLIIGVYNWCNRRNAQ